MPSTRQPSRCACPAPSCTGCTSEQTCAFPVTISLHLRARPPHGAGDAETATTVHHLGHVPPSLLQQPRIQHGGLRDVTRLHTAGD